MAATFEVEAIFHEVFISANMPRVKDYFFARRASSSLYSILFLCDVVFRGISQVFLAEHPISGILICIGLGLSSLQLMLYAIWGTVCSTLGARLVAEARLEDVRAGLCG